MPFQDPTKIPQDVNSTALAPTVLNPDAVSPINPTSSTEELLMEMVTEQKLIRKLLTRICDYAGPQNLLVDDNDGGDDSDSDVEDTVL